MSATLLDKLAVLPIAGLVTTDILSAVVTAPFRGSAGAPTFGDHLATALVRSLTYHLRVETIQWLMPPFVDTYKSWCAKKSLTADIVDIANTANNIKGFWIGNKLTAKYTMVYYHGGGFVFAGLEQHLIMVQNFVKWSNNNLAVFCVAYTLSPTAVYPSTISDCVEGLRYILDQPGHSPSNTLLGGDSAGGNLVLAVLSHISNRPHPQASIVRPLRLSADLKGALVTAPWTSSDTSRYPSMNRLKNRDIVGPTQANYWISMYKGRDNPVPDDKYIVPATAEASWWKDTKCEHMLAVGGEDEALIDAITDWVGKYSQGAGPDKIKYVIGLRETHDTPLDSKPEKKLIELGEKCQEGAIRLWIMEKLT